MWGPGARVESLHRYPVKSLLGERFDLLDIDARGCVGDRLWSVRTATGKIGSGKTTRRFAAVQGLLRLRAAVEVDRVVITMPDGERLFVDSPDAAATISAYAGEPLTLAPETVVSHYDDGPVSLLGLSSVAALAAEVGADVDPARFRANLLIADTPPLAEDQLVGHRLQVGTAVLEVTMRSPRCVMIDMETADLPEQRGNLLSAGRLNDACLGVIATVVAPGRVTAGDTVTVL